MRFSRTIVASGGTLFDLLNHSCADTDGILLKFVAGTVNYGASKEAPFSLTTEIFLHHSRNTKSLYLSGGGTVTVGLF